MDIKIFIKSLSESEHEELINYVTNHRRFESTIIQKAKDYNNIDLIEWLDSLMYGGDISTRLYHGLKSACMGRYAKENNLEFIKLSEVKKEHFNAKRNLGDKSWEEFIKLRGY